MSSAIDCFLPFFVDLEYNRISKKKLFKELKLAIQMNINEGDIVLEKLFKTAKAEDRDKFLKNIIQKIVNPNTYSDENK